MANPFDDPDVKAAASGGNSNSGNVYGGGAYDDNPQPAPTLSQAQQEMAVSVGGAVAKKVATDKKNEIEADYNAQSAQQGNHYSAPEQPSFIGKCMLWLPIRYVAWLGGIALIIAPILDWFLFKATFVSRVIGGYLIFFGIIASFVESPVFQLTRKPQLTIFYWMRLLSRMWGRSWFYFFVSLLCFVEIQENFTLSFLVGIYLFVVALFMLIISRSAANKYRRIFEFIASGTDATAEDELAGKLTRKFDEIDVDGDAKIGSLEIVKLAEQAGRLISNAERHAIQTFLDINCNGAVGRDDFVNQMMNFNYNIKWL